MLDEIYNVKKRIVYKLEKKHALNREKSKVKAKQIENEKIPEGKRITDRSEDCNVVLRNSWIKKRFLFHLIFMARVLLECGMSV